VIHELGHALVSELDLMVLGREEDVADAYATIGVLKCGAEAAAGTTTPHRGRGIGRSPRISAQPATRRGRST
jgi:Putative metallopeptidase